MLRADILFCRPGHKQQWWSFGFRKSSATQSETLFLFAINQARRPCLTPSAVSPAIAFLRVAIRLAQFLSSKAAACQEKFNINSLAGTDFSIFPNDSWSHCGATLVSQMVGALKHAGTPGARSRRQRVVWSGSIDSRFSEANQQLMHYGKCCLSAAHLASTNKHAAAPI